MEVSVKVNFDLRKLDIGEVNKIGLYNAGQSIMKQAQENAPVQTGKLKQSIGVVSNNGQDVGNLISPDAISKGTTSITVGSRQVVYAVVREFVNYKNPDRKFYMARAYEKAEDIVRRSFETAVKIVSSTI